MQKNPGSEPKRIVKETKTRRITIFTLFSFASWFDFLLIMLATLCSVANGALMPLFFLFVDSLLDEYGKYQLLVISDPQNANSNLKSASEEVCFKIFMLAVSGIVFGYFQMLLWTIVGENQVLKIRGRCYRSILSQELGWFDVNNSYELVQISNDITLIQEGITDKLGTLIMYFSNFIISYIIAFSLGWKLALVVLSIFPIIGIMGFVMAICVTKNSKKSQKLYGEVSEIVDEALYAIRTVYAFNGQQQSNDKLHIKLKAVENFGYFKAAVNGIGLGIIQCLIFSSFSVSLYYGSKLLDDGEYDVKTVFNVLLILLMGSVNIGLSANNFSAISTAVGVGMKVFQVIDRQSKINPFEIDQDMIIKQESLAPIVGQIELKGVTFFYPSRPEINVLNNIDLLIEAGTTVAIVGPSGSGKSTIISLIERFYNPSSGSLLLDGVDVLEISVKFLRSHIGLVSQEPVLFSISIRENVLLGLSDDKSSDKSEDELNIMAEEACKQANIHKFIMSLPNQYDTLIGEKGSQLSGGQKQCIAIARAIIKNPSILLLDEATSALDTESEMLVQQALDNTSKGRTTIIVAHRLSTIRNANKIVVIDNGILKETGNHDQLMLEKGIYFELIKSQSINLTHNIITPKNDRLNISNHKQSPDLKSELRFVESISKDDFDYDGNENDFSQSEQVSKKRAIFGSTDYSPTLRLFKIARPWWYLLVSGFFGAILEGAILPFFSIAFTNVLQAFYNLKDPTKHSKGSKDVILWSLMFVAVGLTALISNILRVSSFEAVGESVVTVVRKSTFATYLKQEIGYYDNPVNQVSNLSSKLSSDSEDIPKVISKVISPIVTCVSALFIGLGIAFSSAWKMALIGMICLPFYTFTFLIQYLMFNSVNKKVKKAFLKVSKMAIDSIINIKTLMGLVKEEKFYNEYETIIIVARNRVVSGALVNSLGFGFSLGAQYFVYGTLYWFGTTFLIDGDYTFIDMFQALTASLFIGVPIAQVTLQINCFSKSRLSAIDYFNLLDRKPTIDNSEEFGLKPAVKPDNIDIEHLSFAYPTRPEISVLNGINLKILAGKRTAIVGSTGSGKSTLISLILRFYDSEYGKIYADGTEIKDWNLPLLRSHIAVVSQEPVLFDTTIAENIKYGKPDATQLEIEAVARMANAHSFIKDLPHKYDTKVGPGGSQLSGGQKQRVAIARALINDPKLLLLDEATSALDSESEKVVQEALQSATQNRTTISIAHRLSTIQDYDIIICMRDGSIVERGSHQELLDLKGFYYSLVHKQEFSN